jgi:hypothetical protein
LSLHLHWMEFPLLMGMTTGSGHSS